MPENTALSDDKSDPNGGGQSETDKSGVMSQSLSQSLTGTDSGSDTRAGSLRGGAATGSDDDPDSADINRILANEGRKAGQPGS
jgi:hypothetical protein